METHARKINSSHCILTQVHPSSKCFFRHKFQITAEAATCRSGPFGLDVPQAAKATVSRKKTALVVRRPSPSRTEAEILLLSWSLCCSFCAAVRRQRDGVGQAPLNTLEDLGWSLAYDESVVPASCRELRWCSVESRDLSRRDALSFLPRREVHWVMWFGRRVGNLCGNSLVHARLWSGSWESRGETLVNKKEIQVQTFWCSSLERILNLGQKD